jgi:protein translocase SecG subunit
MKSKDHFFVLERCSRSALSLHSVHMQSIVLGIEAGISVLLTVFILMQHRASGLTSTFGGGGATFVQRRGAEKVIYRASVWLSIAFFALALVQLVLAS